MSIQDFSEVRSLFPDAVTSMSVRNVRQRLNQMAELDEVLARDCCLKTLCSVSEESDCKAVVTDILDSNLFERPHHQKLQSVTPTLVSNTVRSCTSTKDLYRTVSHLASRLKLSIPETLDVLGDGGYSALHLSAMWGDFRTTSYLLELGSDCNKKSESGNTALSLAVAYGHECLVPLLLKMSADVNTCDSDHDTPLMFAAWNNAPKTVSALVQHGADVNKKNKYDSSSIWNAVYQSSVECALILLSNNSAMDGSCEGTDLFFNESDCNEKIKKLYPGQKRSLFWVAVDRLQVNERSLKVLLILLEAGYDVTKEHWLGNGAERAFGYPNNLKNNPTLLELLQFLYRRPQSLKDLSRNSLRKQHRQSDEPFHEWLQRLCLPSSLQDYLSLTYLIQVS